MKLQTPLGRSDFREVREGGFYYVDKSHMIVDLMSSEDKVLLLPRPRRFGKTLNLTMLHAFFDQSCESRALFEGLAVSRHEGVMAHLNAYPTVFLSFKNIAYSSWADCEEALRGLVADLVEAHAATLFQAARGKYRRDLQQYLDQSASLVQCAKSLLKITRLLHRATGKKVVLLIDEYDTPIHKGHEAGYYPQVVDFMWIFLGAALKDNIHLERAVVTGILRVAKESIYSGLNNLTVYSLLSKRYATCFGFTESETRTLLNDFGLGERESEVQAWYNGYRFGDATIYNPWSILSFVKNPADGLQSYWIGTSGNNLIKEQIQSGKSITPSELEDLLRGNPLKRAISEPIAFGDLSDESIWSLLLFSGYLTYSTYDAEVGAYDLRLPNREVHSFFARTVSSWLGSSESPEDDEVDSSSPVVRQPQYGVLSVSSAAGGHFSLNGRYQAEIRPFEIYELQRQEAGYQTILIEREGFETLTETLLLRPGQSIKRAYEPKPLA